jgi:plasmid stabilization system protein ParE
LENKKYSLSYLPLFKKDLLECVNYIANDLQNPLAAEKLVNDVEAAIMERLEAPLSFQPYRSTKNRELPYYRISVNNYAVYYVVIGDVMEVRRLIHNRRERNELL